MVGYNVKAMTDGMNMAGLLPPPYSQLHPGFIKVCEHVQLKCSNCLAALAADLQ